jgi:hypothetical protein
LFFVGNAPGALNLSFRSLDGDGKKELVIGSNNRAIITYTFGEIVQADGSPSVISLVLKNKFPLIGQVTSLCTTQGDWGSTVLLAGLQNGSYVTLDNRGELAYRVFGSPNVASAKHMNRTDITGPTEIRVAQRRTFWLCVTLCHRLGHSTHCETIVLQLVMEQLPYLHCMRWHLWMEI